MDSARSAAVGVLLLTVVAFAVRLVGIDFGAPLWAEGDSYFVGHVDMIRRGKVLSKRSSDNVQYPSLIPRVVAIWPARPRPPEGASLEEHLYAARGTTVQVRTFVALIGVLVIPLTYRLARRYVARGWALFAASIPAFSLLHLTFSQEARPHAALATLFLAAMLACLHLQRRPTTGVYLLAGTLTALCIGCLHSGFLMALPLLAAHVTAERAPGRLGGRRGWLDPRLLLVVPLIALSVRVFYAYAFDDQVRESKQIFRVEHGRVVMSTHKLSLEMWDGSGFAGLLRIVRTWEPELLVLLPLALLGLALAWRGGTAWRSRRGGAATLAAFLVPYLLLLAAYSRTYERFLLPVLPFAAVFSAWGAAQVAARLPARARPALVAALLLVLTMPAYASTRWAWVRSLPDTLELAGAWVGENATRGERVFVSPPFDLPLARSDEALWREDGKQRSTRYSAWARYQAKLSEAERPGPLFDIRWMLLRQDLGDLTDPARMGSLLDEMGPGIYVLQVAVGKRSSRFDPVMRSLLQERGKLEARISPDADPYFSEHPLADEDEEVDDWPSFFRRVLRARACGPVVEVYRIS